MKKILALALALIMALTAVSALAEDAVSPENPEEKTEGEAKIDEDGNIVAEEVEDTDATKAIKQKVKDEGLDIAALVEKAAEAQAEAEKKAEEAESTEGKTEEQKEDDAKAAEEAEKAAAEATKAAAEATKSYVQTLPENVQAQILDEEGGLEIDNIVVNEMSTLQLPKIEEIPEENKKDGKLTIKKTFQTPYKAQEKVKVLVAIPAANGEVKYLVLNGVANEDGDVVLEVTEEQYIMMADEAVVVMPISAAGV